MFSLKVLVLLAAVAWASAVTTVKPHVHHESPEYDHLSFTFDGLSGVLIAQSNGDCYLWSITPDEHSSIHTDAGLRAVELRVLREIQSAVYTVVPKNVLGSGIQHTCKQANTFYLVH